MNQILYGVLGYDQTVALAIQAGQLELNVMMPVMAYSLLEATQILASGLKMLRERCIEGIAPNLARLRHYAESTPQVATALSPKLGYERTAELVQESLRTGESVIEIARSKKLLGEQELKNILRSQKLA